MIEQEGSGNEKTLFIEQQRFKQWWIWLILLSANGSLLFGCFKQVINGVPFGSKPTGNTALIIVTISIFLVTVLFYSFRLETRIKNDGISIRFFPFHLAFVEYSREKIAEAFVRKYNPILEYGGWGIRYGLAGKGKAFNVSGNKGIQLIFKDGSKRLIGTNKPEEAKEVLEKIGYSNSEINKG